MSQWVDIPLATQSGSGASSQMGLSNLMVIMTPPGEPQQFVIVNLPPLGSSPAAITSGSGSMRGMLVHESTLWFVRGTELYYSTTGTTATLVGTVAGTALVRMVGAGPGEIFIVDGAGNEYVATTSAVTSVVPPAGDFSDCTYMDGYVICTRAGTNEFYVSDLDDPTTFGALQFSTADAISDTLVGCIACNRDLVLFGRKHIEIWQNTGASPFPFERQHVIELGCFARLTIQKSDGITYFLGDDRRVYRLVGYTPQPISDSRTFIDTVSIATASLHASVFTVYRQRIYSIRNSTSSNAEYNIETGLWHSRTIYADGFRTNFSPGTTAADNDVRFAGAGTGGTVGVYFGGSGADTATTYTMAMPYFEQGGRVVFEYETQIRGSFKDTGGGTVAMRYRDADDVALTTHGTLSLNQELFAWVRCGSYRRRLRHFVFASTSSSIIIRAVSVRIDVGGK